MAIEVITISLYASVRTVMKLVKLIKKNKEKKRFESELEDERLDLVVINLSGHPLSKLAVDEIMKWGKCKIIKKEIPNIELIDPVNYMDNIINFCSTIIKELIKKDKIINQLLLGKYIVILPGMNSIAATFITMFHGITGKFPSITFFYHLDTVESLIKYFNSQTIRNQYIAFEKPQQEEKDFTLINLTGRFLSEAAKNEIIGRSKCEIIEKQIPNLNLTDPETYMENIINFCDKIIKELIKDNNLVKNLLIGTYAIMPPHLISIALVFIAMFHGLTGHFPLMAFYYKKDLLYGVTKPFDFDDLRTQFREIS